ncbi:hypothetical protein Adt_39228 [Abeliophyllum distichum]|uniref:Uncharacterized protein n=1 Tax=Abeliophyllum distichum TaxID=126358 RepID=A0ABD1Q4H2_9LAMI
MEKSLPFCWILANLTIGQFLSVFKGRNPAWALSRVIINSALNLYGSKKNVIVMLWATSGAGLVILSQLANRGRALWGRSGQGFGHWQRDLQHYPFDLFYFSNLFTSSEPTDNGFYSALSGISSALLEEDYHSLDAPFTSDDISRALFVYRVLSKHLAMTSFMTFSSIPTGIVMEKKSSSHVLQVLNHGESLEPLNQTMVVLILKNKIPREFRILYLLAVF